MTKPIQITKATAVMPYVPRFAPSEVYMCEFGPDPDVVALSQHGVKRGPLAIKPEIYKDRPCVVLSARSRNNLVRTAVVVPFSTSVPKKPEPVHVQISAGKYAFLSNVAQWIKADMIETVSLDRLTPIRTNGVAKRAFIDQADFRAVQAAVLYALNLSRLEPNL